MFKNMKLMVPSPNRFVYCFKIAEIYSIYSFFSPHDISLICSIVLQNILFCKYLWKNEANNAI